MKATKYYTVFVEGNGDVFKGYQNKAISDHLSWHAANKQAETVNGWIEANEDICHPDLIAQMKETDTTILNQ